MLVIDSVVLLEVNYNYELELVKSGQPYTNKTICQYYLLMGMQQGSQSQTHIQRSVHIPNQRDGLMEKVSMRIDLLQQTNHGKDLQPLALLIVNPLNHQNDIEELRVMFSLDYKLEYRPCTIDNNLCLDKELKLKCYGWNERWMQIAFQISDMAIDLNISKIDTQYQSYNSLQQSSQQQQLTQLEETNHSGYSINYETFNEESMKQEELIKRIIKRVNDMLTYLTRAEESLNDEILVKISLLLKKLHKPSTKDIDIELMSIENEIKTLQIICNQWEIIN